MPFSRLEYLFNKYVELNCSPEEEKELMELLSEPKNERAIKALLDHLLKSTGSEKRIDEITANSILNRIVGKNNQLKTKRSAILTFTKVAAAAAVILFISGLAYWLVTKSKPRNHYYSEVSNSEDSAIVPGGKHAILTFSDGSQIVLDSLENETIKKAGIKIHVKDGLLVYEKSSPSALLGASVGYNKLVTPRGGQYEVILPDGTKVWLNTSSCLSFPSNFRGPNRDVKLQGEAYFEVAKNKEKPFHVNVHGMQVEVLGTHFNVEAYKDENLIKTTLLEGSVRIKRKNKTALLKPGEQGIAHKEDWRVDIKPANLEQVVAWKNGLFEFDGADITNVMSEISRWYDVDVVYVGKIHHREFKGKISRQAQLSEVLKILALSNVKFRVEGKKIIVE